LIGPLSKAARRFYLRRPWQLALAVTGIALGVAVYVGVDLANDSARRAFELSADLVRGRATHQLVGVGADIPDALYRELRLAHGPLRAAPIIEAEVRLAADLERRIILLGVDPLEEMGFRRYTGFAPGEGADLARLIVEPGSVLLPAVLARELGVGAGASIDLLLGDTPHTVHIVGTLREAVADDGGSSLPIVTDIASAQELLGTRTVSRVDLILSAAQAERLRALTLPGVSLLPARSGSAAFDQLAGAFVVNLTALSLLALLVGVFLIYATMSFAIVQRRETFGVLRAIGVGRRQLLASVLLEAGVIGLASTVLGLLLGRALAGGLVDLVLATIGDLAFRAELTAARPSALIYWKGLALGLTATLLAALGPALEAARSAPHSAMSRAALERGARRLAGRAALLAAPAAMIAVALFAVAPRSLYLGFGGLFFVIAAGALLIPWSTIGLTRFVEPAAALGFGITGSLAVRGVAASLSRTGVATAALTVAVATVIGVGVMIGSFRGSLEEWLQIALPAEFYLDAEGSERNPFDETLLREISSLPGVAGLSLSRLVRLPTPEGTVSVRALQPGPEGWGLDVLSASPEAAIQRMQAGEGILISEPLAYRRQLSAGEALTLPTPGGEAIFPVLGIYRDYSASGGAARMPLALYRERWGDRRLSGVGVYLEDSADRDATEAALRAALAAARDVELRPIELIRERSLAVFDQTFRITEVLRVLAGLVAFLGLLSALMSIELERAREIAVLRALGLTPRQIGALTLTQTGLLGLAAGRAALPLGVVMAGLLVFVINKRSFGWSMDLVVEPPALLLGLTLAITAALLAGIYPAARAARYSVAVHLREE
jgi:putative ABC transport system permease protein